MYDLAVIGGGIGGYTAAIKAAKKGLSVLLYEKDKVGGTCLHRGCIPTKTMLHLSNTLHDLEHFNKAGITSTAITKQEINWNQFQKNKNAIIHQLYQGVQYLLQKNQISVKTTKVKKISKQNNTFQIEDATGEIQTCKYVILATGSIPFIPNDIHKGKKRVLSSDEIMNLKEIPTSIAIIGGGVIGVEFTTFFKKMGVKVYLIERENKILPFIDQDIVDEMTKIITDENNVNLLLNHNVNFESFQEDEHSVQFLVTNRENNQNVEIKADYALIAIGRKPSVNDITFENIHLKIDKYISVNEYMETSEPNFYAIGDVTGNVQLAHAAAHQSSIAVDRIVKEETVPFHNDHIPKCIYTKPEIASIGLTEEEAKNRNIKIKVGTFPVISNGKSLIVHSTKGFIKVITEAETDRILGVHILADKATEMISEASLAILLEATALEIGVTVHPHPTVSEIFNEAALAVHGMQIHS